LTAFGVTPAPLRYYNHSLGSLGGTSICISHQEHPIVYNAKPDAAGVIAMAPTGRPPGSSLSQPSSANATAVAKDNRKSHPANSSSAASIVSVQTFSSGQSSASIRDDPFFRSYTSPQSAKLARDAQSINYRGETSFYDPELVSPEYKSLDHTEYEHRGRKVVERGREPRRASMNQNHSPISPSTTQFAEPEPYKGTTKPRKPSRGYTTEKVDKITEVRDFLLLQLLWGSRDSISGSMRYMDIWECYVPHHHERLRRT
jgi:hypothetical protein